MQDNEDFQQKIAKGVTSVAAAVLVAVALPFYVILELFKAIGRAIDEFLAGLRH